MIAGLTKKKAYEATTATPILGKIPIFGAFFRKVEIGTTEPKYSELVIFITPHIISGNTPIPKDIPLELVLKKPLKGYKAE